jgi:hypothetical protein
MEPASHDPNPVRYTVGPGPEPRQDPAESLGRLWRQGERPDVDAFVVQAGPLTPVEVAALLRLDQRQRWQVGERIQAEAALTRLREVLKQPRWAGDEEARTFLNEAEALLTEKRP